MKLSIVILAAGKGTRMRSNLPKVMHSVAGRPMLAHVVNTARSLKPDTLIIVHGHGSDIVKAAIDGEDITWVEQAEQLGTGHAVAQVLPHIDDDSALLVLYGDVPLIQTQTLNELLRMSDESSIALLSCELADPDGYGRIVRNNSEQVIAIVEQKDASLQQLAIEEINSGIMVIPAHYFRSAYPRIGAANTQQEYYLTDIVELAVRDGLAVNASVTDDEDEILGVNDRIQLATVERYYQERAAWQLMTDGATLIDPSRIDIRGEVSVGYDVVIDVNVIFEGKVRLGDGVTIGSNCIIKNSNVNTNTNIDSHCVIEDAIVGENCNVGPYARLRPGTVLKDNAKIGNFVETKNAEIGVGSKVNHLSYIGDSVLGNNVNIGAGTITCNYDGANKHKTTIGDNAFIGSNTALVAPVKIGKGATIGAGSTINKDAPDDELTLTRAKQSTLRGWQRPKKNK
ncbi:MAG: bifunctional UDP-N-acetylglucosamine diphosphorylase/glucosamine-1-phosphate N-acetyltransferase GlmU [Gammaproteobacteria bacterium]|nr:bifunctional UDP-N-acetylglucosamine diphosphorylase/glucosamine-1-phosphate N-acetyltransferase GlmU [Gammaproteobacteria bacterium]